MKNTKPFKFDRTHCLIIDEADRILDAGFEKEMVELIQMLPTTRHNVLFSATESDKTQALKNMIYQKEPIYVRISGKEKKATVSGLRQEAVFCPSEDRMMYLFGLVNEFKGKKVMVFFNSCISAKFHADVVNCFDHGVKCIHVSYIFYFKCLYSYHLKYKYLIIYKLKTNNVFRESKSRT